jgi:autotransporter translocation and assembly factor TamB
MSDLNPALRRLQSALTRLERALDQQALKAADPGVARAEINALNDDRARLAEALDQSLAREQDLKKLAEEASEALGAAIAEVRAAIGSHEG